MVLPWSFISICDTYNELYYFDTLIIITTYNG